MISNKKETGKGLYFQPTVESVYPYSSSILVAFSHFALVLYISSLLLFRITLSVVIALLTIATVIVITHFALRSIAKSKVRNRKKNQRSHNKNK